MPLTQITSSGIANGAISSQQLSPTASTPKISNIQITNSSGTVLDDTAIGLSGGYIKINGTGFAAGAQVIINNTAAISTTFTSASVLNAQVGAQSAGSYVVYVTNTDGGSAILWNGLTYSATPTWVTGTTLTTQTSGVAISIQLSATGANTYALATGSSLPAGLSLSSGGLLSGTVTVGSETVYSFTVDAIDTELQESPRTFSLTVTMPVVAGQQAYTTAGTYSWTAPAGVTSVCVVCVGGGGSGGTTFPKTGGGGGGLGWKNNITVVPGQNYTVVVGAAGPNGSSGPGGDSYFINTSTVRGAGGAGGNTGGAGGSFVGDGGQSGGNGGIPDAGTNFGGGGGGAGGYRTRTVATAGNGGKDRTNTGQNGEFGGGGGGGAGVRVDAPPQFGGAGGGVGILGEGANGTGSGSNAYGTGIGGAAGSGGAPASGDSRLYGGGGQSRAVTSETEPGANGAVRIIWGSGRAFPSTNTGNL